MAEELRYEQKLAVTDRGGKLLVSAAAGSGKTKVLVERLMGYIQDPVSPAQIDDFLIITYTKAAAAELRSKIAAKLSDLIAQNPGNQHLQKQMIRLYLAKISTVHAFCTDILRHYAYKLDISADFRVGDENECLQLQMKALENILNQAYGNAEKDSDFRAFVDSQGFGRDDRQIPEIIFKVYNRSRCHMDPEKWLDWCIGDGAEQQQDAGQTPWGAYLLDDLKKYVSLHIDALEKHVKAASGMDGMEKPVALLRDTITQLQLLCESQSWDDVIRNKDIDYGRLTFPKKCGEHELAEKMKVARNACKEGLAKRLRPFGEESSQILADFSTSAGAARGLVGLVRQFAKEYERLKRLRGILDFGDLEHLTLDLFLGKNRSGITAVANEVGNGFREIMVDEYQDSNEIQDAIFASLTEKRQNCFMVGDVKQSIYQFRLADPSIFIGKYNTYKEAVDAKPGEGRRILLSHNFRSSAGVISGVNDVFAQCMSPEVGGLLYGESEMLREGIPHTPLNEPEVSLCAISVDTDTYAEEANFVADRIQELLDGSHFVRDGEKLRPIRPEDIAILLRSPGSVGGEFQFALRSRGIQCTTGDTADLLGSEEIGAVISILQVIANPLQDIPLMATLTSPVFGFTAEDLAVLRSRDRQADLYTLLLNAQDRKCVEFLSLLNRLRQTARLSSVSELLSAIFTETGLLSTYSAFPDGATRLDNLQTFYQTVSGFEAGGPKELTQVLEFLEAAKERGLVIGGALQDKGAVTLMSIHKSKGLEFPVVFLCGLSRRFNRESVNAQVLCDKDLGLGLSCVDANLRVRYPNLAKRAIALKTLKEGLSEELRVLYVAMTRARDRLIMTYADKNLDTTLHDFAMRLELSSPELLCMEAGSPGDWVLQTALGKTEAGALFALGGNPGCAKVSNSPWQISVIPGYVNEGTTLEQLDTAGISAQTVDKLRRSLSFAYSHTPATGIPSKLTATQLKGREVDKEIAEGTRTEKSAEFRNPSATIARGRTFGNAMHAVMQYIDIPACSSEDNIRSEINRMVEEHLISEEQAAMADVDSLCAFFQTTVGKRLQKADHILREFKFSVLDDASKYYPDAGDEKILLQGVVDCAIIEDDGLTILDFKTDRVTEQTISQVADQYRSQVQAYASALSRIYQKPVKSASLYFFNLNRFVDVI